MPNRRTVLAAAAALPFLPLPARAQPTPACGKPTERQTAGPFFRPNSPQRSSLLEKSSSSAQKLVVSGHVLGRDCKPIPGAVLDFWHADESGEYDNRGFRYRGHQLADAQGRYRLETIVPAEYPGRARHIHVNVAVPGRRILTTQLYFPQSFGHHRDGLYQPALEIRNLKNNEGAFDFVIDA